MQGSHSAAAERPREVREAASGPVVAVVGGGEDLRKAARDVGARVHVWTEGDTSDAGTSPLRGDPASEATYEPLRDAAVVLAVVALEGPAAASAAAVGAIRRARPDAAVLVIGGETRPALPRTPLVRYMEVNGRLRRPARSALRRLHAVQRVERLRSFAEGADVLPILIQAEPDPDALGSALAVRVLLRRTEEDAPIITLGENNRPENRRMAELLNIRTTHVTEGELGSFERVVAVDVQPAGLACSIRRLAVIDHHPVVEDCGAELTDIRPHIGATATILTEYLRADDPRRIRKRVATALLYGIRTDTATLTRGSSAADVRAYALLQRRADTRLLARIERASFSPEGIRALGAALDRFVCDRELAVAFAGELPHDDAHVAVDLADFCLAIEGVAWVVTGAVTDGSLVLTVRRDGAGRGAGELAARLARPAGSGGGHQSMGRATLELADAPPELSSLDRCAAGDPDAAAALADWVRTELDALG